MPRRTNTEKSDRRGSRRTMETRTPRPKPKIDFTADALDFKNTNLLRQFVTDQGRILPRKYTGLPAHYQRRLTTRHQTRASDVADEVERETLNREPFCCWFHVLRITFAFSASLAFRAHPWNF